ncbi:hypothetical protein [Pleionea sediminis]|uniref:hypothetical protein n=1 Tax=Pleionea sediminis TaxID=2569479 RepID=UPI0011859A0F|nr:hypothetical protein [Pleionea sediminis]
MSDRFSELANQLIQTIYPNLSSQWEEISVEAHYGSQRDVFIQFIDTDDVEHDIPDFEGSSNLIEKLIEAHNPNEPNELLEANITITKDGNVDVDVQYHNPVTQQAS